MNRIMFPLLVFVTVHAAAAEPPIGQVRNVAGDAWVMSEGAKIKAEAGTPIYQGSVLETGKKSSMGIVFQDDTVMSFGAETVFSVDEYLYSPNQGKLRLGSRLTKGTLNYVSGAIAKLRPEAVTVSTPSGVIGVRGTQFLVKVEE